MTSLAPEKKCNKSKSTKIVRIKKFFQPKKNNFKYTASYKKIIKYNLQGKNMLIIKGNFLISKWRKLFQYVRYAERNSLSRSQQERKRIRKQETEIN